MMKLALLLVVALCCLSAAYAQQNQTECLGNCSSFSNGTCCGCCDQGNTCHENRIKTFCCSAGQNFCGCISSRAFCLGRIWGSSETFDTFGNCYDPSKYSSCYYDPNPNYWILCPTSHSACYASGTNVQPICCKDTEMCMFNRTTYLLSCASNSSDSSSSSSSSSSSDSSSSSSSSSDSSSSSSDSSSSSSDSSSSSSDSSSSSSDSSSSSSDSSSSDSSNSTQGSSSSSDSSSNSSSDSSSSSSSDSSSSSSSDSSAELVGCGSRCGAAERCCQDAEMGSVCYSTVTHTCAADQRNLNVQRLCPVGHNACGLGCYRQESYCCSAIAGLIQRSLCAPGAV